MSVPVWLTPPLAFLVVLAFLALLSYGARMLGAPRQSGGGQPYACGEEVTEERAQPDYGQFYPFAFFFTVLHVVALTIATVPSFRGTGLFFIAALYVLVALIGLSVIFRRVQ